MFPELMKHFPHYAKLTSGLIFFPAEYAIMKKSHIQNPEQGETVMSRVISGKLQAGVIFGDWDNSEYIYLPAGEVGSANPVCVLETGDKRTDLELDEAVRLIVRLGLKPVSHPRLGKNSF